MGVESPAGTASEAHELPRWLYGKVALQITLRIFAYAMLLVGMARVLYPVWGWLGGSIYPGFESWLSPFKTLLGFGQLLSGWYSIRAIQRWETRWGLDPGKPESIPTPDQFFHPRASSWRPMADKAAPRKGRLRGRVSTWLAAKQYGFVLGDDGNDYVLRGGDLEPTSQAANIQSGDQIEFDQAATPKGYRAKRAAICEASSTWLYELPTEVMTSKSDYIRGWDILEETHWAVYGHESRDLDSAKSAALDLALTLGANAILELTYQKATRSESSNNGKGTYYYTVHCFSGRLATLGRRSPSGQYAFASLRGLNHRIADYAVRLRAYAAKAKPIGRAQSVVIAMLSLYAMYLTPGWGWRICVGLLAIGFLSSIKPVALAPWQSRVSELGSNQ